MRLIAIVATLILSSEAAFGHMPCFSGVNLSNASTATQEQAYCFWYSEAPKLGTSPEVWNFLEIFIRSSTSPMTLAIATNGARDILQENLTRISTGTLVRAAEVLKEASAINDPRVQVSATSALLSLGSPVEREARRNKDALLKRFWSRDLDAYYLLGSWGNIMDTAELIKFCEAIIERKLDNRSIYSAVNQIAFEIKDHPKIVAGLKSEIVAHLKTVMTTKEFGFVSRVTAAETLHSLKAISSGDVYKFTLSEIMNPGDISDTYERYSYGLRVYQIVMEKRARAGYEKAVRIAVQKYHIDRDAEEQAKRSASSSDRKPQEYFEKLKAYR